MSWKARATLLIGLLAAAVPAVSPPSPRTGEPRLRHRLARNTGARCFAVSPDGRQLAVGGQDGCVLLLDSATGRQLARLRASENAIRAVAFHPGDKWLATGEDGPWPEAGGVVRLWDLARHKPLTRIETKHYGLSRLSFSPDGRTLSSSSDYHDTLFWSVPRGQPRLEPLTAAASFHNNFTFSPDGSTAAASSMSLRQPRLRLWDVPGGRLLRETEGHRTEDGNWLVEALAFAPGGNVLASAGPDIRLWATVSGQMLHRIEPHDKARDTVVTALAFHPDGEVLASGDSSGGMLLWNSITGRKVSVVAPPGNVPIEQRISVQQLAFTRDGRLIALLGPLLIDPDAPDRAEVQVWELSGD